MDRTLVLCMVQILRREGRRTLKTKDSVMISVATLDEILPAVAAHFTAKELNDRTMVSWKLFRYLPQKPFKR